MKPDPERPEVALGVDVLAPEGYGEIIGGGERLADLDLLLQRIEEHELPQEAFEWYLDLRRYGTVPHGGFGMGIERVRRLDLRARTRPRDDSVPADALPDVSVTRTLRPGRSAIVRSLQPRACLASTGSSAMKIGLVSLGCPKNLVDSEVMLGLAQQAGHELTQDAADGRRAGRQHLRVHRLGQAGIDRRDPRDGAAQDRRRVPAARSSPAAWPSATATSCEARFRRSTRCSAPAKCRRSSARSAAARGAAARRRCVRPLRSQRAQPIAVRAAQPRRREPCPTYIYDADTPRLLATPRHYAYVKIAEGCDYKCAFCIIPTLRGAYRSRPADSIVREARALAARGVKELLLISQDTTFYGIDRSERGALGAAAARAERGRRPRVDPAALSLSDDDRRRRRWRRWRSATRSATTSTCRCSTRRTRCSSG